MNTAKIVTILSLMALRCTGSGPVQLTLSDERSDGQWKICYYDDLGSEYAKTVHRYESCPRFIDRKGDDENDDN